MKKISIVYCRPGGYERRAAEAAAALRKELGVGATLVAGKGGIFEVQVGAEVVSKRIKGYFPDSADIVKAVSAAL